MAGRSATLNYSEVYYPYLLVFEYKGILAPELFNP